MKAVILAAGQGRRLGPMGWDKPKCLLPCPGGTLLDNTLQSILERGIREVIIVVGYQREVVERSARGHPVSSHFVVNEDYAITNTVYSLWLAREYLDGGFLYFNGDVWFEREVVALLMRHEESTLAVDVKRCGAEDVKVKADPFGRIIGIGKDVPPAEAMGEFIGVAKFERSACPVLVESLRHYSEDLSRRDCFFESALNDILDRQVFLPAAIGKLRALEIDTPEDYARAQSVWMV